MEGKKHHIVTNRKEYKQAKKKGDPKEVTCDLEIRNGIIDQLNVHYKPKNFFQSKLLKVTKKVVDDKDEEFKQKLLIWQAEQYAKMRVQEDEEERKQNRKKKNQVPKSKVQKEQSLEPIQQPLKKQSSYSRILNDLKQQQQLEQQCQQYLISHTLHKKPATPENLDGTIQEVDEDQISEFEENRELKLPQINDKNLRSLNVKHPFSKRLCKIHSQLQQKQFQF